MSDIIDPSHPLVQLLQTTPAGVNSVVVRSAEAAGSPQRQENRATDPRVRAVAEEYMDSEDRLHGDTPPNLTVLRETPTHRLMIYLHAMGKSAEEIATQLGRSKCFVYQILRQPWARQRLVSILKEAGQDEVKHFLKTEVSPSLEVLREIRDNPQAKASDRASAANSILDRALGKPTVHVETDNTNRNVPADLQRLDQAIAAVQQQLSSSGHGSVNIRN